MWLVGPDGNDVGETQWITWPGVDGVGSDTEPLPAGDYYLNFQDNNWQQGVHDFTVMFYFKEQRGGIYYA